MPTKNIDTIRINGGGSFYFKKSTGSPAWVDFGKIARGYEFTDDTESITIDLAGGEEVKQTGKRPVQLVLEMAQTDKTALDYKDTIDGISGEVWFEDGIVNNKYLEFYGKKATAQVSIIKKDGDTPQKIKITLTFEKQAALVSVINTALPTETHASAGTWTGTNKYYVWGEVAVT